MNHNLQSFCCLQLTYILLCLMVSGCTIQIEPSLETPPLFSKIQARVGISIPKAVKAYTYQDELIKSKFGEISASYFNQAFQSMFSETSTLPSSEPWQEDMADFDAIIELRSVRFNFIMGGDGGINPDVAFVSFKVCLYRPDGTMVNCWEVDETQSHQRHPLDCIIMPTCESRLTKATLRSALAKFMINFERDPIALRWALELQREGQIQVNTGQNKKHSELLTSQGTSIGLLNWPTQKADPLDGMYECLEKRLLSECAEDEIVHQEKIRELLFPLMEPSTQPENKEGFTKLLLREDVQTRLNNEDVAFLIAFSYNTLSESHGSIVCGGGYAAAGCFGFAWIDKDTSINAEVWGIGDAINRKSLETNTSGTTRIPAFIAPIPILARTEANACKEMGNQVVDYLRTKSHNQVCR